MSTKVTEEARQFRVGEIVYFLSEYNLLSGTVISVGRVNLRILVKGSGFTATHEVKVPLEKCAHPGEMIAVVWEMWKGRNGRGGYRIERSLYPDHRRAARNWPYQAHVNEVAYGEVGGTHLLDR